MIQTLNNRKRIFITIILVVSGVLISNFSTQARDYPNSLFEDNEVNSFLNSMAHYSVYNEKAKLFFQKTTELNYFNLSQYSSNILTSIDKVTMNTKINENAEAFNRLIFYDLFKAYVAAALGPEYKKFQETKPSVLTLLKKMLKENAIAITAAKNSTDLLNKHFKILDQMVVATKGDNSFISKSIRKMARYIYNVYNKNGDGRGITTAVLVDRSSRSLVKKSLNLFNAFFKYLDFTQKLINEYDNYSKEMRSLCFFENYAYEYLINCLSIIDNSMYDQEYISAFTIQFIEYVQNVTDGNIDQLIEDLKKMYTVKSVVNVFILAYSDKAEEIVKKCLNIQAAGFFFTSVSSLVKEAFSLSVKDAHTMYFLYINLLYGLNSDSVYSTKYGYINGRNLQTNLLGNLILHQFVYYATRYLQAIASEKDLLTSVDEVANAFKISTSGIEMDPEKMAVSHIFKTSLDQASGFPLSISKWIVKKFPAFMTAGQKPKDINDYISDAKIDGIAGAFTKYAGLVTDLLLYEKFIVRCLGSEVLFNDVANDNIGQNEQLQMKIKLQAEAKKYKNQLVCTKIKTSDIFRAHLFNVKTGIHLMTDDMFKELDENVYRKDFYIMLMKSPEIDELPLTPDEMASFFNPYEDESFLKKIYHGDSETKTPIESFYDLDQYYPGDSSTIQKLSLNEVIWLLYGRDQKYILGYPVEHDGIEKRELRPFDNVKRKEAIAILGRIYRSLYKEVLKEDYHINGTSLTDQFVSTTTSVNSIISVLDPVFKSHNIADTESLYNQYKEFIWNIGVCVNEGLIVGAPRTDGTYHLELERNLTLREAMYIVLRFQEKIQNSIFKAAMLETDFYYIHNSSESHTETIENSEYIQNYQGPAKAFGGTLLTDEDNYRTNEYSNQNRKKLSSKDNSSILTLYSNKSYKLKLNTKIPEKYYHYITYDWLTFSGELTSSLMEINDQGNLMPSIIFKTPILLTEQVIPLIVFAVLVDGTIYEQEYYIKIKPYSDYIPPAIDNNVPDGQCSVYYQKEQFILNCSLNENTDFITIQYTFEFPEWKQIYESAITTNKKIRTPLTINHSEKHTQIFFRVDLENTTNSKKQTLETIQVNYEPPVEYTEKSTEIPDQPVLNIEKKESMTNTVRLEWLKVIDSHLNDNVVTYEVQYDTSYNFSDPILKNIGNPARTTNKNEVLHFYATGLEDSTNYYFRIRGINNLGSGKWSNVQETYINIPDKPVFMDLREPENNAVNVSKTPVLKWRAWDEDHDRMAYRIVMGLSPDHLNMTIKNFDDESYTDGTFDFSKEFYKALDPNTTYYWQVWVNEEGYHYNSYVKSTICSFTTADSRPDLIITDALPIEEIRFDQLAKFKVTVKNQGAEATDYHCFSADYIKNDKISPFKYVRGCLYDTIQPGETKDINVSIRFWNDILEYDGIEYDNVLISGKSKIRFKIESYGFEDGSNNNYDYDINYENSGAPNITYFNLKQNISMYTPELNPDFYAIMGQNLQIGIKAIDDIQISKGIVQYRLSATDFWKTLIEENNNGEMFSFCNDNEYGGTTCAEFYVWKIPDTIQSTDSAQVKVILFDDQNLKTETTSDPFSIVSNKIEGNISLSKLNYKVGEKISFDINLQSENKIMSMAVFLTSAGAIYYDANENGLPDHIHYEYTIPNNNNYASNNCRLSMYLRDDVGNKITIESKQFQIQIDAEIPSPFDQVAEVYKQSFIFPADAQYKNQSKAIRFIKLDDNNVAHVIVEHSYSYFQNTATLEREDNYVFINDKMYITYTPDSKIISTPIKVCDKNFDILDMSIFEEKPYVLLKQAETEKIFYTFFNNENKTFQLPVPLLNKDIPELKNIPEFISSKSNSYIRGDHCSHILYNGSLWGLNVTGNYVEKVSFTNGIIGENENIYFQNSVGNVTSEDIQPVISGSIVYFIDLSMNKLIKLDLSAKTIVGYDLPFTPAIHSTYGSKTALAVRNNKIFIFGNGSVYCLENENIIEKAQIQYTLGGKTYKASEKWSRIYFVKAFQTENDIYLLIHQPNSDAVPQLSHYDILLFDSNSFSFTKNIASTPLNARLDGVNNNPRDDDFLYIGNNKVIVASVGYQSHDNLLFHYESNLKMLDLLTGDIQNIGNLPFKGSNYIDLILSDNNIYAVFDDNTDEKLKSYKIQLSNIDNKINQYYNISFFQDSGKLYALWAYGNPYDGRWNEFSQKIEYYLNRKNQFIQIAPNTSDVFTYTDEYIGWNVSIHDNYLSTEKLIGKLNNDLSLGNIVYQSENLNYRPFQFFSYGDKSVAALTNYLSSENCIELLLLKNDLTTQSIHLDTIKPTIASFDDTILIISQGDNTYDEQQIIMMIDPVSGNQQSLKVFNKSFNPVTNFEMIDINKNKYAALAWNNYIALGNFSNDMIEPVVQITSNSDNVFKNTPFHLEWSATDNLNQLVQYEIYEIIGSEKKLIKSIHDISEKTFTYNVPESGESIILQIRAIDSDNNIGEDEISITPISSTTIKTFTVNSSQIETGDKLVFKWTTENITATTLFSIYSQKVGTTDWTKISSVVASETFSKVINDYVGEYRFKIETNNSSLICDKTVNIAGVTLTFDYLKFNPKNNVTVRRKERSLSFEWAIAEEITPKYSLYIKQDENAAFELIHTTSETSYKTNIPDELTQIQWKVVASYNQKELTSNPIEVIFDEITSPDVKELVLTNHNTQNPSVEIHFNLMETIDTYILYRKKGSEEYQEIANIAASPYNDSNVKYGNTYMYAIASKKGDLIDFKGNSKSISVKIKPITDIQILNENYENLSSNSNTIKLAVTPEDGYKHFEVLLYEDDNEVSQFTTNSLEFPLENLKFNQYYKIKICPLNEVGKQLYSNFSSLEFITGFDQREITEKPVIEITESTIYQVSLIWNEIENADDYIIFRKNTSGNFENIGYSSNNSYSDSLDIKPGKTYTYMVQSRNANITGPQSLPVSTEIERIVAAGDINFDKTIDLKDAILGLQILSGIHKNYAYADADFSGDNRIGIEEILFIFENITKVVLQTEYQSGLIYEQENVSIRIRKEGYIYHKDVHYLVWCNGSYTTDENYSNYDKKIKLSTSSDGIKWNTIDIIETKLGSMNHCICIDDNDSIHIAYNEAFGTGTYGVDKWNMVYANNIDGSWEKTVLTNGTNYRFYSPAILVKHNGLVHLYYNKNGWYRYNAPLYKKTFDGQNWSAESLISNIKWGKNDPDDFENRLVDHEISPDNEIILYISSGYSHKSYHGEVEYSNLIYKLTEKEQNIDKEELSLESYFFEVDNNKFAYASADRKNLYIENQILIDTLISTTDLFGKVYYDENYKRILANIYKEDKVISVLYEFVDKEEVFIKKMSFEHPSMMINGIIFETRIYNNPRQLSSIILSQDDTRRVLYITNGNLNEWHIGSNESNQLLDISENIVRARYNPENRDQIVFQTYKSGYSTHDLRFFDKSTSEVRTIFPQRYLTNGFDFIDKDNVLVACEKNDGLNERTYVSIIDINNGSIVYIEDSNKNEHHIDVRNGMFAFSIDTSGSSCHNCCDIKYGNIQDQSMVHLDVIANTNSFDGFPDISPDRQFIAYYNNQNIRLKNLSNGSDQVVTDGNYPLWIEKDSFLFTYDSKIYKINISNKEISDTDLQGFAVDYH